jgi:cysteine desulfurase
MSDCVYLDYAASTPPAPEVAELLHELQGPGANPANPSAMHVAGRRAATIVQSAAEQLAALLNCDPARLVWTSGATESDNLAIRGAAAFRSPKGRHLVTMPTEHKAVTDVFRALERDGYEVSWLRPDKDGILAPERLEAALREDTQLVSVMAVNNETGVVQDITALGDLCREQNVLFHVDAAQAAGKVPLDLGSLPVDLLSLTAHKMYGPKGIGALYVAERPGCQVEPLLFGGGQQRGLRPGTLPVPLLAGFGLAAELAGRRMASDRAHLEKLRDALWRDLRDLPGIRRNGAPEHTFPGILNVSIEDVEGESLLLALEPLCVATGSACNSQSGEPSAVLRALGLSDAMAQSAIRFSFGRPTRLADVEFAAGRYREAVARLRALAPERAA